MSASARLVLLHDPAKVAPLHPARPLTIGREANNLLCMPTAEGVAPHHAVVRFSRSHGWVVCDWGSPEGTWLEGQRIRHCRPLGDGDHIQLGPTGPVLVFQLQPVAPAASPGPSRPAAGAPGDGPRPGSRSAAAGLAVTTGRGDRPAAASPPGAAGATDPSSSPPLQDPRSATPRSGSGSGAAAAASGRPAGPRPAGPGPAGSPPGRGSAGGRAAAAPLAFAGRSIPLEQVRSVHLRSRSRFPQSFSWWVLLSLGGLVLLPWPWLFWPLEVGALMTWILLGSRKEHVLIVTLRDGMAHRHSFANRITALSHRNGLRKAIGQTPEGR